MAQDQELQGFYTAAKRSGLLDKDPEIAAWSKAALRAGLITDTPPAPPARPSGQPTPRAGRKAATGALMDELSNPNRPENRAAPRPTPARPGLMETLRDLSPLAAVETLGDLSRASTAATNEAARAVRGKGSVAGIVQKGTRALMDPTAVEKPQAVSILTGATNPNVPAPLRWAATLGDFIVSVRTDPGNVLGDPLLREAGGALAAGARALAPKAGGAIARAAGRAAAKVAGSRVGQTADKVGKWAFGEGRLDEAREMGRSIVAFAGGGPRAKEVARDVQQAMGAHAVLRAPAAVAGTVKGGMLANPASALVNAAGGFLQGKIALDRAGVAGDLMVPFVLRARNVVKAAQAGRRHPILDEFEAQFPKGMSPLGGFEEMVGAPKARGAVVKAATAVPRALLSAQDTADRANKLAAFWAMRSKGVPAARAAKIVDRVMFNYSDRSALVLTLDRYGIAPFATFGSKALKGLVEGAVEQPHLMRRFLAARERMYADPEARKAYEAMPDHEKGLFVFPVGKNPDGTYAFVNAERFNPYGSALKTVEAAREMARTGKPPKGWLLQQASRPLIAGPVANLAFNRKLYGDDPEKLAKISEPGAPPVEQSPAEDARALRAGLKNPRIRELVKGHVPSARGATSVAEAIAGQAAGDSMFQGATPLSEAVTRALVGVRGAKSEPETTPQQKRARLEQTTLATRRKVAGPYIGKMRAFYNSRVAVNPFDDDVAALPPHVAASRAKDADRYVTRLMTSGRVVNAKGELTDEGRSRLRDAVAYAVALRRRSGAKR